jgi:RNA polymerase sigma-32 factor
MISGVAATLQTLIQRTPRLTREEELALVRATRNGDERAGAHLVASHLRFVLHIARRYRRFGCPAAELLQEGTLGLMEAIRRFNPDRGVRLSTYAMWWIRAAIQDYVVRSRSLVRIGTTAAQKSMFFALCRRMGALVDGETLSEDVTRAVAVRFNASMAEVAQLARRIARADWSLDAPCLPGEDAAFARVLRDARWLDGLADTRPDPEERLLLSEARQRLRVVLAALGRLPPRELLIIQRRYLAAKQQSRTRVGRELGLSKERVRQLEVRALGRLRAIAEAHGARAYAAAKV